MNICIYIYNRFPLLYTCNQHNMVSQLYSNFLKKQHPCSRTDKERASVRQVLCADWLRQEGMGPCQGSYLCFQQHSSLPVTP